MSWRAMQVNRAVKRHDPELYALNKDGVIHVFRYSRRFESHRLDDESYITWSREAPHYILSLTHNWKMAGRPVDWGILPLQAKLKAMDLWNRDIAGDLEKDYIKDQEGSERDLRNNIEAFLYDYRREFAKATDGINTGNLDKKFDKRRFKDGSRK